MRPDDWPAVRSIYEQGIPTRQATVETSAPAWEAWDAIFPENVASLELHSRCGFRVVGTRERIAQLDGVWRDTVLMERRPQ